MLLFYDKLFITRPFRSFRFTILIPDIKILLSLISLVDIQKQRDLTWSKIIVIVFLNLLTSAYESRDVLENVSPSLSFGGCS